MVALPLHADVVKKALGADATKVEALVRFMASREGERVIPQVATTWARYVTANTIYGNVSEADQEVNHQRALLIVTTLFNAPRLELYSYTPFDYSVLSNLELVDGLIAICELRDYRSCVKEFEEPMDTIGYIWAKDALLNLRKLLTS